MEVACGSVKSTRSRFLLTTIPTRLALTTALPRTTTSLCKVSLLLHCNHLLASPNRPLWPSPPHPRAVAALRGVGHRPTQAPLLLRPPPTRAGTSLRLASALPPRRHHWGPPDGPAGRAVSTLAASPPLAETTAAGLLGRLRTRGHRPSGRPGSGCATRCCSASQPTTHPSPPSDICV